MRLQYVRYGRNRELYSVIKVFEVRYFLDLQIMPITLDALVQMVLMCGFQERFSCIIIPRNVVLVTLEMGVLLILTRMSSALHFLRGG